jgi:hypothetical protein
MMAGRQDEGRPARRPPPHSSCVTNDNRALGRPLDANGRSCPVAREGERLQPPMRLLPVLVTAKPLPDLARREHDLTVRGGARQRRPHLDLPLLLRFLLRRSCQTAVALLDPFGLGARPSLRPKTEKTEAGLAIDPDSHHFAPIVARTDEGGGRKTARRRRGRAPLP